MKNLNKIKRSCAISAHISLSRWAIVSFVIGFSFSCATDKQDSLLDNESAIMENAEIHAAYKEALSDIQTDFDLNSYRTNGEYRHAVDQKAEMYIRNKPYAFGDNVLVLSTSEIGENGEGLSRLLCELNSAISEGGESLEEVYEKIRMKKHWRSPSIEARIDITKELAKSRTRVDESEDDFAEFYEDSIELGETIYEESDERDEDLLTVEDLLDDRGMLVVGTMVNIFLEDTILYMPLTVFKQIVDIDPSILDDLEEIHRMSTYQKVQRYKKAVSIPIIPDIVKKACDVQIKIDNAASYFNNNVLKVIGKYKSPAQNLLTYKDLKGWRTYGGVLWYYESHITYDVNKPVFDANNATVSFKLQIKSYDHKGSKTVNDYPGNGGLIKFSNDVFLSVPEGQKGPGHYLTYSYVFSVYAGQKVNSQEYEHPLKTWTNRDMSRYEVFSNGKQSWKIGESYSYVGNDGKTYNYSQAGCELTSYVSFSFPTYGKTYNQIYYGFEKIWMRGYSTRQITMTIDHVAQTSEIEYEVDLRSSIK